MSTCYLLDDTRNALSLGVCAPGKCDRCGWFKAEIARRKHLIRTKGLEKQDDGTRCLMIPRK